MRQVHSGLVFTLCLHQRQTDFHLTVHPSQRRSTMEMSLIVFRRTFTWIAKTSRIPHSSIAKYHRHCGYGNTHLAIKSTKLNHFCWHVWKILVQSPKSTWLCVTLNLLSELHNFEEHVQIWSREAVDLLLLPPTDAFNVNENTTLPSPSVQRARTVKPFFYFSCSSCTNRNLTVNCKFSLRSPIMNP